MDPSVLRSMARWPQRVYVALAYAPLVLHYEGEALVDHCGHVTRALATFVDEEGSVLIQGGRGLGLLDDRDLARFAARLGADWRALPKVASRAVAACFGFVSSPSVVGPAMEAGLTSRVWTLEDLISLGSMQPSLA